MNKDKKKTMVLGALGTALIAVGAFQFIPKGSGSSPPEKLAKPAAKVSEGPHKSSASGTSNNSVSKIESNTGGSPTGDLAKKDVDPHLVWTILDCEGKLYVAPGFRYVNRIDHVLCAVPWTDDDERQPAYRYD